MSFLSFKKFSLHFLLLTILSYPEIMSYPNNNTPPQPGIHGSPYYEETDIDWTKWPMTPPAKSNQNIINSDSDNDIELVQSPVILRPITETRKSKLVAKIQNKLVLIKNKNKSKSTKPSPIGYQPANKSIPWPMVVKKKLDRVDCSVGCLSNNSMHDPFCNSNKKKGKKKSKKSNNSYQKAVIWSMDLVESDDEEDFDLNNNQNTNNTNNTNSNRNRNNSNQNIHIPCPGCCADKFQGNQEAHMGPFGCLGDDW